MKDKKSGKNADRDIELWNEIKKTAKPLKKKFSKPEQQPAKTQFPRENPAPKTLRPVPPEPVTRPSPNSRPAFLDEPTTRKLAKGKLSIDGRLDLHGMTQAQAHDRLLGFLLSSQKSGKRLVLVITGKGQVGGGVLRHGVPRWLSEPVFRDITNGYSEAHISHGGAGALYVRIRRVKSNHI